MKRLIVVLLIAALTLSGAALADALPDFFRFPDPGQFAGGEAKLFQAGYSYKGVSYDAYEYPQPADTAAFLADWEAALAANGYMTSEGDEQENAAVFFAKDSLNFLENTDGQGFLLYDYQGRMLLMVPASYEFVPGETVEVPALAAEPVVEEPAVEEPVVEEPAAEPNAEPAAEPAAVEAEPEATPAPDMSSDMVEEFDPAGDAVPIEYTLDQDFLANPNWEEELAAQQAAAEEDPHPDPYPTLKKGDKGDDVKALQEALISLGYLKDKADGMFGGKTEKAVKTAQKKFKLEQTGVADDEVQRRVFNKVAKRAANEAANAN